MILKTSQCFLHLPWLFSRHENKNADQTPMLKLISSVMTLVLFTSGLRAEEFDLFILAGQSNAHGWMGEAAKYPADPQGLDAKIRLWWTSPGISSSDGKWTTMQKQAGRFPVGHFGLEVAFGRKLKLDGCNPAIFKFTLGSTSIANNWKLPGQGGMYDDMVRQLAAGVELLRQEGHTVKFRGFVWIQGESDAETKPMAQAYEERLKSLITDLRDRVTRTPDLPMILGVDEQHPWVVANPEVVQAQQNLAKLLTACTWTSMKELEKADSTHLTPAGLVLHGERIHDAWVQMIRPPAPQKTSNP